jgi:lipopolysaccharide biosynthesis glycosyltransferase
MDMDDMCNAGVLMLPAVVRSAEKLACLISITERYDPFVRFADQSAISLWCKKNDLQYCPDYEYNFQVHLFSCPELRNYNFEDIRVLHFSSSSKPNTVEFMLWSRIPLLRRKQLAKMFVNYLGA